jgi:hypothetical protein
VKIALALPLLVFASSARTIQSIERTPPAPLPASLVIDSGRSVTGDGQGAYVNGDRGVLAFVGGPDGGTFFLRFDAKSPRAFSVALTRQLDSADAPRRGVVRCDAGKTSEIAVHDILSIPVGGTALRPGHIQLEIEYADGKAFKGYDLSFNDHEIDPVPLFSVTRTSATQWIIENQHRSDGDPGSLRWALLPAAYPRGNGWTFLGHAHFQTSVRLVVTLRDAPPEPKGDSND